MEQTINSSGLMNRIIHSHIYEDKGEFFECPCGKRKLKLKQTSKEGLREGIKKDGKIYLVRDHRSRFFFPNEWNNFYKQFKAKQKPIYDFLIQSGCRIDEGIHVRPIDFDLDRTTVRFWKTKTRAKLGERAGKPRTISLSPIFMKRIVKYFKAEGLDEQSEKYLFSSDKEHNNPITKQAVYQLMKRKLKKTEIKDPYNFSLHNIRKTHGNWIRALGVPADEVCLRLGHDMNTYLKHYGSSSIFSNLDIIQINKILEGLYQPQRRF